MASKEPVRDKKTGINIHPNRDDNLNDFSKTLISNFYLKDDESIQEGFARASKAWSGGDDKLAQRLYDYVSKGWFMFASPVLSNAPEVESLYPLVFKKTKGMPISCYLGKATDSVEGLINHSTDTRWLSIMGGGVGGHWSEVRSVSKKSPGPIPFLHTVDADMEAYRQSFTRRGSYAAYLDVDHPDIIEFLNIRVPTGDVSRKCHSVGFHNAINISDKFMEAVEKDLDWDLIDPADKTVRETLNARDLWNQILEVRYRTGEPYLYFIDEVNRNYPKAQLDKGLKSNGSNLCLTGDTEIDIKIDGILATTTLKDICDGFDNNSNILVKSYDTTTNNIVWSKISAAAQTGITDVIYKITSVQGTKTIECTPEHKIYTANRGYVEAQNLESTDTILFLNYESKIKLITTVETNNLPVFDITVDGTNNFYANDILVHNCIEITLPTADDRIAVCCLSSLNIEKYDEWKNTTIVQDLIKMLDNVISYFIENAPDVISKAKYSAMRERSLGLGALGFHYYLQKNFIPFESERAAVINKEIFSTIKERAVEASLELGNEFGECPDLITEVTIMGEDGQEVVIDSSEIININGQDSRVFNTKIGDKINLGIGEFIVKDITGLTSHSGRRNANLLAVAPNANSSIIIGTSPSIEPTNSNAYIHQTRAGSWPVKNPHLEALLDKKGLNTQEVWNEIINSKGSIQEMDIFTDEEKLVFKTAIEINQVWVVNHAADRQPFICQSQSVNLFFPPKCDRSYFSMVHRLAWKKKMKSLYYIRTVTPHRAENVSMKVERNKLEDGDDGSCIACEG